MAWLPAYMQQFIYRMLLRACCALHASQVSASPLEHPVSTPSLSSTLSNAASTQHELDSTRCVHVTSNVSLAVEHVRPMYAAAAERRLPPSTAEVW